MAKKGRPMAKKEKGCQTPDWTWSSPRNKECPTEKSEKGCQTPDWSSLGYGASNSMSTMMDTSKTKNIYSSTEPSVRYRSEKNGEKPLPTGYGNVVDCTINKKNSDSGCSYGERLAATGGFGQSVMQSSRSPIPPSPIFTTPKRTTLLNVLPPTTQVQVDSIQPVVTSESDTFSDGRFQNHAPLFPSNHLRHKSCEDGPSPPLTNESDTFTGRIFKDISFHQSYEDGPVDMSPLPTIPPHVALEVEKDEHGLGKTFKDIPFHQSYKDGPVDMSPLPTIPLHVAIKVEKGEHGDVAPLPIIIPPHVAVSVKVEKDVPPLQVNQPHLEPKTSVKVRKDVGPLPSIPQSEKLIKMRKDVTFVQGIPPHAVSVNVEKDVAPSHVLEHLQPKTSTSVKLRIVPPLESIAPHIESKKVVKLSKNVPSLQSTPPHIISEKSVKKKKNVAPSQVSEPHLEPKKLVNFRKDVSSLPSISPHVECEKLVKSRKGVADLQPIPPHIQPDRSVKVSKDVGSVPSITQEVGKKAINDRKRACEDGYNWRKYGEKRLKENNYVCHYYKCTYKDCKMKRRLQGPRNDGITKIIYNECVHNHPKPHQTSDGGKSLGDDYKDDQARDNEANSNSTISIITDTTTSTSKTLAQKTTGIDILDDGYEWNIYGRRAIKDSPNARTYYCCRHIGCPAKRTLQRASDDPTLLIPNYKEKHNHDPPKLVIT